MLFAAAAASGHLIDNDPVAVVASASSHLPQPVTTTDPEVDKAAKTAAIFELSSKPRKSTGQVVDLGGLDSSFAELDSDIAKAIINSKISLSHCIRGTRRISTKITDFVEVSFHLRPRFFLGYFEFSEVRVERSTLELTTEEEGCLTHAFEQLRVGAKAVPPDRIFYPMCVNSR